MKVTKTNNKTIIRLLVVAIFCVWITPTAFGQMEKLGSVSYSAPKGWTKTAKVENVLAFSTLNEATGTFCIITLYGATPGTGNAQSDFTREWKKLAVDVLSAPLGPQTETQMEDGWTATAGGSAVEFNGVKAIAFLTVISGYGKTVSVLGVFNEETYVAPITAFVSGMDIDKTVAAAPQTYAVPTQDGKVIIPMPSRQLTVADLAGQWSETSGFSTTYVNRYTGSYAGTDSLHYRNTSTITKNGGYTSDFFAIQNGKKIIDKTTGSVSIDGRVFTIRQKNTAKYVIRGWLELPEMTVFVICGPWYDDQVIPENIFTNPDQGSNLNSNWIRKR